MPKTFSSFNDAFVAGEIGPNATRITEVNSLRGPPLPEKGKPKGAVAKKLKAR